MNDNDKWYTPEENMPPYGKKVLLNIKFPYSEGEMHTTGWFKMHTTGWFEPDGWHILALIDNYTVEKWRYFYNDKHI